MTQNRMQIVMLSCTLTAGEILASSIGDSDEDWQQLSCSGREAEFAAGLEYLHVSSVLSEGPQGSCW